MLLPLSRTLKATMEEEKDELYAVPSDKQPVLLEHAARGENA
jgi:hypothetical protein